MKRINCILIFLLLLLGGSLYAQTDSIISVSGEVGGFDSSLDFLNETGGITQYPRLTDAGELLYYAPVVSTDSVPEESVWSSTATVYGNILFNGWCESVLEQGFQISTTSNFSTYTIVQVTPANPYTDCELPCSENVFSYSFTELTPSTTYYVRAYATNSEGTSYGEVISFTTLHIEGSACGECIDYSGYTYGTVQIGRQCWMKENLRTTKYADGTSITQGNSPSTTTAYWYYPNNNSSNKSTYGLLYNWKAVMRNSSSSATNPSGIQGICPSGWHVPSDIEWMQMEISVGMSPTVVENTNFRGDISARLSGNTGWHASSTANAAGNMSASGRNSSGFSALPAGSCLDTYQNFGYTATFWSATAYDSGTSYGRYLIYNNAGVNRYNPNKGSGYSVRCVKDGGSIAEPCMPTSSTHNTEISTDQLPYVFGDTTFQAGTVTGTYILLRTNAAGCDSTITLNLTVTAPAFTCGTSTLTDIDGNTYNTVQIGSQCWMRENLRTTKYSNGNSISQGSTNSAVTAYWYYPNNSSANKSTYGLLYNWKAVMRNSSSSSANPSGVQGICPMGWHVPSDEEWKQMERAVGMSQSDANSTGYRGDIAAKLSGNTGWVSSSITNAAGNMSASGRNSSGFSALPAGGGDGDSYSNFGREAFFWSATESDGTKARLRHLSYNNAGVSRGLGTKGKGYSVRCVKD